MKQLKPIQKMNSGAAMLFQGKYDWLIFKTNVTSEHQKLQLENIFEMHTDIPKWTIDLEDTDKVLRVKETHKFNENKVMRLLRHFGINIEPLTW